MTDTERADLERLDGLMQAVLTLITEHADDPDMLAAIRALAARHHAIATDDTPLMDHDISADIDPNFHAECNERCK